MFGRYSSIKDYTKHIKVIQRTLRILNWGIRKFDTIKITKKNEIFTELDVWLGKKNKVSVTSNEDFYITIPKRKKKTIKAVIEYEGPIQSPIKKGDNLALLNIYVSGELKKQINLI